MTADIEKMLSLIAGSYNLNYHCYSAKSLNQTVSGMDGGIRIWEDPTFQEYERIKSLFTIIPSEILIHFYDRFGCHYLMLLYKNDLDENLLAAGPFLTHASTSEEADSIREKLKWDKVMGNSLFEYRNALPVVLDTEALILIFRRVAAPLAGKEILPLEHKQEEYQSDSSIPKLTRDQQYEQSMAASMIKMRYQKENDLLDAMLTGNPDKTASALRELKRFQLPGRFSSLRGAQNMAIILNTLFRKNLERAHIHPAFIDQISREFTERITSSVSEEELRNLQRQMIHDYSDLVCQCAIGSVSPLLQEIMNKALLSLDGEVSLQALAEEAKVSESYLSARFKEETGITFSTWLRRQRMSRAKELLKQENLTVAEVAEQIGIFDVSYFIRIFKREFGMTPGEFRKSIYS